MTASAATKIGSMRSDPPAGTVRERVSRRRFMVRVIDGQHAHLSRASAAGVAHGLRGGLALIGPARDQSITIAQAPRCRGHIRSRRARVHRGALLL